MIERVDSSLVREWEEMVADGPETDADRADAPPPRDISRDPRAFELKGLAERAEPLTPAPQMSLWTDQFNNLLDVLKTRPWDAIRSTLHLD
jgi:hypothetical protein